MAKIGENEKKLLQAALKAVDNAYVLWGFKVGAAVLAEDGQVYDVT
jgi:cytidine deaminase